MVVTPQVVTLSWRQGAEKPHKVITVLNVPESAIADDVTLQSQDTSVCTVSGRTIQAVGVGSTTVIASCPNASNDVIIYVTCVESDHDYAFSPAMLALAIEDGETSATGSVNVTEDGGVMASLAGFTVEHNGGSNLNVVVNTDSVSVEALNRGSYTVNLKKNSQTVATLPVRVTDNRRDSYVATPNSVSLNIEDDNEHPSELVTVTKNGESYNLAGATLQSSKTSVATAAVENGKVKITAQGLGTATISIKVDGSTVATIGVTVAGAAPKVVVDKTSITTSDSQKVVRARVAGIEGGGVASEFSGTGNPSSVTVKRATSGLGQYTTGFIFANTSSSAVSFDFVISYPDCTSATVHVELEGNDPMEL